MSRFRRGCVMGMLVLAMAGCGSTSHHRASGGLSVGCSKRVTTGKVVTTVRSLAVPVSGGKPSAVVGTTDGRWMFASAWTGHGGEIAVSGDDRYVFVGDEDTGGLSVFDLGVAVRHGYTAPVSRSGDKIRLARCERWFHVGSGPTGILVLESGPANHGAHPHLTCRCRTIVLVGDSNRDSSGTGAGTAPQAVNVIDTAAALAHRPALTGVIPAGLFPRDLSYDPATGQVLLANYDSDDIELFAVPSNR